VNGNRGTSNQLTINGIGDIDTGSNGSQNVTVSIDSMAEFKVLTGQYQAEYGRNAGAQIALVTKSGTSEFHGSGYIYHRHDDLNADTFINNVRGLPRTLYRYNDPGYTIGGPVFIPHLLTRTKNKLFFFWSQEWQEQLNPNGLKNVTVPTALERQGNFSQSVDNNNRPLAIRDPLTQAPLPGNIVPANRIYGPGQALANVLPLPNTTGTGYNYTSQASNQIPRREDLLRGDYNVTDKLRLFGQNWLYNPGLIQFDVSVERQFVVRERLHLQLRADAFNVINHANFTGLNTVLNFNAYPTSNGAVTGLPALANNATPYNAAGQLVNVTGFGSVTSPAAGAPGGPRVLQLVARITF
jgi:hypothetical protein